MVCLEQPAGASARPTCGWLWLAGVGAALALYVVTLAPDLVWQDSGDYQFEAARLHLSRPGDAVRVHPWFLVVAWLVGRIPAWNYAYAANLASALGTALAVGNVLLLVRLMTGRVWPAALAATTLAVGHTVWAHAVMAETYGWTAAFLSAECLCAWAFLTQHKPRWLLVMFFIDGVAVSNHLMAGIGLAVFAVWVLTEVLRRRAPAWALVAGAACWIVGGTLYWIVLGQEYARTGSLIDTLHSATVGAWGDRVFNVSSLPGLLWRSVLYVGLNYATPLVVAVFVGAVSLARRRDTLAWLLLILAAVYLGWAARYKVPDQYAFFIPFYVLASVMIGVGVAGVTGRFHRLAPWGLLVMALLPIAVYAVLPTVARGRGMVFFTRELPYRDPYTYFLQPWKTGYHGARRFAQETLDSLPQGAILFADSTARPPLVCVQQLEGRRTDVLIASPVDPPWTAGRCLWSGKGHLLFSTENRRRFVVSDQPSYRPPWVKHLKPFGYIYEIVSEEPVWPSGASGRSGGAP